MLNRLLAPFSLSHEVAYINDKIEQFYTVLSAETLQAQYRAELLGDDKDSIHKKHTIQCLFEQHAIQVGVAKVWTRNQFSNLVTERLRDDPHLADILWRSLCYEATYPLPEDSHTIDLAGFIQAVTRLTHKRPHQSLHSFEHRRKWTWKRFASMTRAAASSIIIEGDWTPPSTLDNIAQLVRSQLPVPEQPYKIRAPPIERVRPRVQAIFGELPEISTNALEIPYEEMLALLTVIMGLTQHDDQSRLSLGAESDWTTATALARAVLDAGQIEQGDTVSWTKYLNLSEKYHIDNDYERKWAFDHEITRLWEAFFNTSNARETSPSQHPPTTVLQALKFFNPLSSDEHDPEQRQESTLTFSSKISSSSRQAIVQAFDGKFYSRLAVIYGTTIDQGDVKARNEPAVFTILTSAPERGDDGYVTDFLVGDSHLLLELAPVAHALWFAQPETHYDNLIHITDDGVSFGTNQTGLTIDLNTGTAVLASNGHSQVYQQVAVGPVEGTVKPLESTSLFQTEIQIERIEIYDLPDYTAEDRNSIERPHSAAL